LSFFFFHFSLSFLVLKNCRLWWVFPFISKKRERKSLLRIYHTQLQISSPEMGGKSYKVRLLVIDLPGFLILTSIKKMELDNKEEPRQRRRRSWENLKDHFSFIFFFKKRNCVCCCCRRKMNTRIRKWANRPRWWRRG
jgi:hypothetical protein